jgi:hypothetical protein
MLVSSGEPAKVTKVRKAHQADLASTEDVPSATSNKRVYLITCT